MVSSSLRCHGPAPWYLTIVATKEPCLSVARCARRIMRPLGVAAIVKYHGARPWHLNGPLNKFPTIKYQITNIKSLLLTDYPFTAPSDNPRTRYFCTNNPMSVLDDRHGLPCAHDSPLDFILSHSTVIPTGNVIDASVCVRPTQIETHSRTIKQNTAVAPGRATSGRDLTALPVESPSTIAAYSRSRLQRRTRASSNHNGKLNPV